MGSGGYFYRLSHGWRLQDKKAVALARRLKRLILAVDSMECAMPLNEAAKAAGITLEVRLEVDTGAKRTGVQRTKAAELAKEVHQLSI